ncbi:hypothetical protein ACFVS2_26210 [Brevibacillus sp. NPDC058079]|uniref:hypothetical protein n=1 Tax=Brevibacillus sp. NPDC058079 TaxID=3346330 RepID=UPI0036E1BEDD
MQEVTEFHGQLYNKSVCSFVRTLSGYEKDLLLRMLLEVMNPLETIEKKLDDLETRSNVISEKSIELSRYIQETKITYNDVAMKWFIHQLTK